MGGRTVMLAEIPALVRSSFVGTRTRLPASKTFTMATRSNRGRNVLGKPLASCSTDPMTGFFRDGCCRTGSEDQGLHLVCTVMTEEFLVFSKATGNDLSTPRPEFGFPGLKAGDRWCLCVERWKHALEAGAAPKVNLEATHVSAIEFVDLEDLQAHSAD